MSKFLVLREFKNTLYKQFYTFYKQKNIFAKTKITTKPSYTSILHNYQNEHINMKKDIGFKQIQLDKNNTISIINQDCINLKNKYKKYKNYAIFSPYHILLENIKFNKIQSSANILHYDNRLYFIIINSKNKIIFFSNNKLSTLNDIKKLDFYNNSDNLTKLYNEILNLETQSIIKEQLKKFYLLENSFFIENIQYFSNNNIIYNSNLLIKIKRIPVDWDDTLLRLTQKELNYNNSSYTNIKKNPNLNYKAELISFISLSMIASIYLFYPLDFIYKDTKIIDTKQHKTIISTNHKKINTNIVNTIKNVFNTITYDTYIKKITFNKNESIIDIQYINKDTYFKSIKDKLSKLYKSSTLTNVSYINGEYSGKIINKNRLSTNILDTVNYKLKKDHYTNTYSFIKSIYPDKTRIKIINKNQFYISMKITDINKFFNYIDQINKSNNPLLLSYPIIFTKNNNTIDINFKLTYMNTY
jgi:hypothetical protein